MFTHMHTYTRIIYPSHKYTHTNHTPTYTWTYAYTHIHASLKGRTIWSESSIHRTHTGGFWVFRVTRGETFVFPKGCLYFSNGILHAKMLWVLSQSISKCIRQGWIDWVEQRPVDMHLILDTGLLSVRLLHGPAGARCANTNYIFPSWGLFLFAFQNDSVLPDTAPPSHLICALD